MFQMLVLVAVVLFIANHYRQKISDYITLQKMIGKLPAISETAYPIIGHSYLLAGSSHDHFKALVRIAKNHCEKLKRKFFYLWFGPLPMIFLTHPEAAAVILKSSQQVEKSFVYKYMQPWLGTGLVTSGGEKWKQRRRLLTSSFHFEVLKEYIGIMNEQARICIENLKVQLKRNETIDIEKSLSLCMLWI